MNIRQRHETQTQDKKVSYELDNLQVSFCHELDNLQVSFAEYSLSYRDYISVCHISHTVALSYELDNSVAVICVGLMFLL